MIPPFFSLNWFANCFVLHRKDITLVDILEREMSVMTTGAPFTVVVNRRDVLRSAIAASVKPGFSFFRPVEIVFAGEEAVDVGGPKREFFR